MAALARGFSDRHFERGEGPGDEVRVKYIYIIKHPGRTSLPENLGSGYQLSFNTNIKSENSKRSLSSRFDETMDLVQRMRSFQFVSRNWK